MRLAVLSDIHANLAALDAVRADLPAVDEVWLLGDIVGHGPQPNEVIRALQEMGARSVMGNHDGAAIGTVDVSWFNSAAARSSPRCMARRATRPGSTSPARASPRPTWRPSTRGSACTATPTCQSSSTPTRAA